MKAFSFVLAVLLLGSAAPGFGADQKIATLDLRKVFDNYWKTKQADSNLKEQATDLDNEMNKLKEDYKKATDEYTALIKGASDQAVAVDEREKRKKGAEDKLVKLDEMKSAIEQFRRTASSTMLEKQRRMRDEVLKEISEIVKTHAKAGGYSMVVDTAAESDAKTPILIYFTTADDLTEAVLKELNANAPPGVLKNEEKK